MDDFSDNSDDRMEDSVEEDSIIAEKDVLECFAIFDLKNAGIMPPTYFDMALRSLGIMLTASEMEDALATCIRDGVIELSDFAAFASEKINDMDPKLQLKIAFGAFDPDNEGVIPTERFRKWMTTLGDPLTDSEAKEMCKMGDPGNKGWIVYENVIRKLLN